MPGNEILTFLNSLYDEELMGNSTIKQIMVCLFGDSIEMKTEQLSNASKTSKWAVVGYFSLLSR